MSTNEQGYTVGAQVHINKYDATTGNVIPGWEITVYDKMTGNSVPVFVPDANYGPEQARTLIEHALEQVRGVHRLGQ